MSDRTHTDRLSPACTVSRDRQRRRPVKESAELPDSQRGHVTGDDVLL